jgi:hypothetical protein
MTTEEINDRLAKFENDDVPPRLCYGWYWRIVDFDRDDVWLGYMPDEEPDWWKTTAESKFLGQAYEPEGVRFCENNKWGYPMFKVEGEAWAELRRLCETADPPEISAYMQTLRPK